MEISDSLFVKYGCSYITPDPRIDGARDGWEDGPQDTIPK